MSAIIKAAKSKQFGQAYNLGSGKETTVNYIANLISKKKTLFLKDQENPIVLEQIFLKHAKILIGNQKFLLKRVKSMLDNIDLYKTSNMDTKKD